MKTINLKREVTGNFEGVEGVIERVTAALKTEGFGVLTRIDFHSKIKEKLGKEILPTVILGACNPQLAYDAFQHNSDVASLLPCNAVVREVVGGKVSVELAKPSSMMEILGDQALVNLAQEADQRLERVLEKI